MKAEEPSLVATEVTRLLEVADRQIVIRFATCLQLELPEDSRQLAQLQLLVVDKPVLAAEACAPLVTCYVDLRKVTFPSIVPSSAA